MTWLSPILNELFRIPRALQAAYRRNPLRGSIQPHLANAVESNVIPSIFRTATISVIAHGFQSWES
jgi:hypothetical protein